MPPTLPHPRLGHVCVRPNLRPPGRRAKSGRILRRALRLRCSPPPASPLSSLPHPQGWNPDRSAPTLPRCLRRFCCSIRRPRSLHNLPSAERWISTGASTPSGKWHASRLPPVGMRLRGGRDLSPDPRLGSGRPPPASWLPGVLTKGVRLRLRLDHRDDRGRSFWQLVDLEEAGSETGLMSTLSAGSEMQTPGLGPQFMAGPQEKVPGRKRGRPPIRKLEFQSHYAEPLSALKIPKKRGRKPGFKLKPRMVMSPLANSPPSSTPEPEMGSIPQDAAIVPHSATPQVLTETPTPDVFPDSKRYAVDPSDSAFNLRRSQYAPKHSYSYRGGSCAPLLCRQMSSPASYQDGNRNAYSAMPEVGESKRPAGKDPSSWGVEEVVWFIKDADPQALGPHADTFRKHEIDGDALLLLKSEMMMKYLGLKLGPALKLCYHIDRLKQNRL
ncbi:sex comb on midleg-like protein 4 isoform X2 [Genypterus blacodes]|uniref:sex comb on midleg-like protein 4 isoform X2 n=1 Tax=Genypterus blacodes TaxID=154954 RepID=UPI003F75D6BD